MQNARDILRFVPSRCICLSKSTKDLLSSDDLYDMEMISSSVSLFELIGV